jgi:hypothetical protein
MGATVVRTAELRADDPYLPPATSPTSRYYKRSYSREEGYDILAGQDITDKQYRTTRYMLLYNPTLKGEKRSVILTAPGKNPRGWILYAEGKTVDMLQMFERLDGKPQDIYHG